MIVFYRLCDVDIHRATFLWFADTKQLKRNKSVQLQFVTSVQFA